MWQATRQAAQEKKAEVKEVVPTQAAPEPLPDHTATKLPVGRNPHPVHVDYNYFEVGTGQVKFNSTAFPCDFA